MANINDEQNTATNHHQRGNIRIDIVSDIVCPWCIIGYKRLEKALEIVSDKIDAELHWHPFLLNPQIGQGGVNYQQHLMKKYGRSLQDSIDSRTRLVEAGLKVGFSFDFFDEMKTFNTFLAHQLLHYAKLENAKHSDSYVEETNAQSIQVSNQPENKHQTLKLRLMTAFFAERKEMDDIDTLVAEAEAIGLDGVIGRELLLDGRYADIVEAEMTEWAGMGVSSVPTYVFNKRHAIAGAYEPEMLATVILDIAEFG